MKDIIFNILRNPLYMFWACFILHIFADFKWQGILGSYKCKDYWNVPDNPTPHMYWRDWFSALVIHSIEWSAITFFPLIFTLNPVVWSIYVIGNAFVHAIIDHMKANLNYINLNQDQMAHFFQIIGTLVGWCLTNNIDASLKTVIQ